jgi:hypothetical protein
MDRYDEAKHVRSMRPDDEFRSMGADEDVLPQHSDEVRVVRIEEEAVAMNPDERVRSMDRDISMPADREMLREEDMPRESDRLRDEDMPKREGDILGLGGAVVPKSSTDQTTEYDEESIARRRARSTGMDERAGTREISRSKGATGIDMGSGGEGTDLE